jgi:uncharacterized protein (TIGR03382 family)
VRTLYVERMNRADDVMGPLRWVEDLAMPAGEGQLKASAPTPDVDAPPTAPKAQAPDVGRLARAPEPTTPDAEAPRVGCSASASGVGAWWAEALAIAAVAMRRRRMKRS